jgi:hypothetical protein
MRAHDDDLFQLERSLSGEWFFVYRARCSIARRTLLGLRKPHPIRRRISAVTAALTPGCPRCRRSGRNGDGSLVHEAKGETRIAQQEAQGGIRAILARNSLGTDLGQSPSRRRELQPRLARELD